ncbi:Chloroplastic group IIA intron splicing facilitator CRS1, chloroplastic [Apostasia shenzhenica]|uniref:Chloroplastic group IIA intron splicing facilitator CRS1, chloroplastic n=1 Tax=Apostasia shenzhenica TaxID=1088818 RepID=A0A2I0BBZ5_9ASPA|nr:Chloroplastic group IIA intron splicing facilitator CRS1, chloroplastic [Apostasia shenzhenica]
MPVPAFFCAAGRASVPPKPTPPEKPWLSISGGNGDGGATAGVRMPTAPWLTSPLILPTDQVLDLSKTGKKNASTDDDTAIAYLSLTSGIRGGRSRAAMRKILKGVSRLRKVLPPDSAEDHTGEEDERGPVEIAIPLEGMNRISSSEGGEGTRRKVPWAGAKAERMVFPRVKKKRMVAAAEMVLPPIELERLKEEARSLTEWVRAKKAGVTPEVVEGIRRAWRKQELAMVKIVEPLCKNMVRAHEIVETKTGGIVVWRKKDIIVVYRGINYRMGRKIKSNENTSIPEKREAENSLLTTNDGKSPANSESLYVRETNRLLEGLGPRFIDWWWRKPLPVDADLLPEIVPGFMTPFRLCPPDVRSNLSDDELTYLRKLARPLPTHFALSKNKKLHGVASAIIKLWEKSLIAKIAIKVGIPNTNNEQMALELKRLTGGVLILRNKFFIILFRGKDFLPGRVASSVLEREAQVTDQQQLEEECRLRAAESFPEKQTLVTSASTIGTLTEFEDIQAKYLPVNSIVSQDKVEIEAKTEKLKKSIREHERSLFTLNVKIERSQKVLSKFNKTWSPLELSADRELLTEEERESLRKVGLKMDEFLLLGRRGIYDGVIGSIHQHWKYRELVKVISFQKAVQQIAHTARLLEIESGGIVVAIEKQGRGHVIIIYRGRNYARPLKLVPDNLLTKREALQRSIEIQRRGSLRFFAEERQQSVTELRRKLEDLEQRAKEYSPRRPHRSEDLN